MLFWLLVSYFLRALATLRYRIEVKGLKEIIPLSKQKTPGILFLPNHTAHMDPILLFLLLWPKFRMRPLVVEYVYRNRLARPFMRLVNALPIPNFETAKPGQTQASGAL